MTRLGNAGLRFLILILIIFTVYLCFSENKDEIATVMTEDKSYSLPIYSVETDKKVLAITFDAAWGDEDLRDIIEILEKHKCKATFFVTGEWALKYPDAVKLIYGYGHELGNHGNNHKHMTSLNHDAMLSEIEGANDVVKGITGFDMKVFRAPYGDYNEDVVLTSLEKNMQIVQWDVDSLDWKDYGIKSIIETVLKHKGLKNGSIILLHNGSTYTRDALDELLTGLDEKGYEYLTISELIYTEDYYIDHTGRQYRNSVQK